ncbi:MFS transporter [Marinilabiliaceae bacterium JC040]|nr:MFS transporter [Marinilabiliaceae bacterium JC040]
MKSNIKYLYLIKFSKWFTLVMPILIPFYQKSGLSITDIMLLKSIYSIAIVIMEIPSGYLADIWGRRKTLLIGGILAFIGFAIYSITNHFLTFLMAEITLGLGHSLISGADSALLYDSLKSIKQEDTYLKHEGKLTSLGNFSEAIAGILSGIIAAYSYKLPFIIQSGIAFIGIPSAIMLQEPKKCIHVAKTSYKNIFNVLQKHIQKNKILRLYILLSSITGCATLSMAWFVQIYLKEINLDVEYFGIIWTVLNLSVGISSMKAYKIYESLGEKTTTIIGISIIGISYIICGIHISIINLITLVVFYLVRGVVTPIFKDFINKHTKSEIRATILSIRNFIIRIIFAIMAPIFGYITDNINLNTSLIITGSVFFILNLYVVLKLYKRKEVHQIHP